MKSKKFVISKQVKYAVTFANGSLFVASARAVEVEASSPSQQPYKGEGVYFCCFLISALDSFENRMVDYVPFHFNKEVVESGAVTIHYVPTADNIADLYTKAVSKQVLDKLLARALGYSP